MFYDLLMFYLIYRSTLYTMLYDNFGIQFSQRLTENYAISSVNIMAKEKFYYSSASKLMNNSLNFIFNKFL